jgi:hypothetical protein
VSFPIEQVPALYTALMDRWSDRNDRMSLMTHAVNGKWAAVGPDDEDVENRSPNVIQVALEDTAEAASLIPTVRVSPSGSSKDSRKSADLMERLCMAYMDASQVELLTIRTLMDLVAFGTFAWYVSFDKETGGPIIQWRDPQTCFPEPGWKTMDSPREVMFARNLYVTQLPHEYQDIVFEEWPDARPETSTAVHREKEVILIEYVTEEETLVAALYQDGFKRPTERITYRPVELERVQNPGGICPVVIGQRISLDNEPRGQFDQIIGIMRAHIRLMSMVLDYADQAVYSDVWVKDLIGPLNFGGGAYIQLGPQGQIGRVQPAVSDFAVFRELDSLIESMHLGGRWPKSRPGEVDQSIASAKFLEASAGMMNTVIRTLHLIMTNAWERALRVCLVTDKLGPSSRTVSGVLRNQQFMIERKTSDIDLEAKLRVEYGIGLGRDPAQSMVLGIQASQAGLVSTEFVQENFEGISDLALERTRLDVQRFHDMALARLLQGLEAREIPDEALVQIAQARLNGKDIFELFQKFVVEPQKALEEQMLTSGLTGEQMMPGGPAPEPGMGAPPAPSPDELFAMLGAGGGPPGEGPDVKSRINTPMGEGSFISSNT